MTTFDPPQDRFAGALDPEPSKVSGIAIGALVCSLFFCIPVLPPIGVVLGLVALVGMVGKEHLRGRGMAIAAIVLGLFFSIGWGIGGYFMYTYGRELVVFIRDSPAETMQAGLSGDIPAFKERFHGAGAAASDAEAEAFLAEVRNRYGTLREIRFEEGTQPRTTPNEPVVEVSYIGEFSNASVPMRVELVLADKDSDSFIKKIGSIEFIDPDRGNLRFPPLPPPPATPAPSPTVNTDASPATPVVETPANGEPDPSP